MIHVIYNTVMIPTLLFMIATGVADPFGALCVYGLMYAAALTGNKA